MQLENTFDRERAAMPLGQGAIRIAWMHWLCLLQCTLVYFAIISWPLCLPIFIYRLCWPHRQYEFHECEMSRVPIRQGFFLFDTSPRFDNNFWVYKSQFSRAIWALIYSSFMVTQKIRSPSGEWTWRLIYCRWVIVTRSLNDGTSWNYFVGCVYIFYE